MNLYKIRIKDPFVRKFFDVLSRFPQVLDLEQVLVQGHPAKCSQPLEPRPPQDHMMLLMMLEADINAPEMNDVARALVGFVLLDAFYTVEIYDVLSHQLV